MYSWPKGHACKGKRRMMVVPLTKVRRDTGLGWRERVLLYIMFATSVMDLGFR